MPSSDDNFLNAGFRYILAATDLHTTLSNLVKAAAQAVGSECGTLYLLNKQAGVLEPYILVNVPEDYLAGCKVVPVGTQCCGRATLHKMPWVVEDMWTDPLFADCREAAQRSGMRSGFSVPVLAADGECHGTLGFQFREPHCPSLFDVERSRLFAQLIAFAIAREKELTGKKPSAGVSILPAVVPSRTAN